jgi:hypothetical protein
VIKVAVATGALDVDRVVKSDAAVDEVIDDLIEVGAAAAVEVPADSVDIEVGTSAEERMAILLKVEGDALLKDDTEADAGCGVDVIEDAGMLSVDVGFKAALVVATSVDDGAALPVVDSGTTVLEAITLGIATDEDAGDAFPSWVKSTQLM